VSFKELLKVFCPSDLLVAFWKQKRKTLSPVYFSTFFEIQFTKALPLGRRKEKVLEFLLEHPITKTRMKKEATESELVDREKRVAKKKLSEKVFT
jgi:hypothetical protein